MRVAVVIEHRYDRTPDGAIWTSSFFAYSFWLRYLEVFDEVKVVARVRDVPSVPGTFKRADGDRVVFAPLPYYVGPWQYVKKMWQVDQAVRAAVGPEDAVILRLDSQLAASIERDLWRAHRPYGAEIVVDPYDVFAPGSVDHPLRAFFRWWFPRKLRRQCRMAAATAFVTKDALQVRYPPRSGRFTTNYSSVELPEPAFAQGPRAFGHLGKRFTVITVTLLDQLRKAPHTLIEAVAALRREGMDPRLIIVGDGRFRPDLEALAARTGVADSVDFIGQLPSGEAVWQQLDRSDLFVLASYGEGLPRAAIEAMARGLPCIGSTIEGFYELLPPEDLIAPGNLAEMTAKIKEVIASPERMNLASARNLEKARDYGEKALRPRRLAFYSDVKRKTEDWLRRGERVQLALINTEPRSWDFWKGQGAFMRARGIESHCISSDGELLHIFGRTEEVTVHPLKITRTITPLQDFATAIRLARLYRRLGIEIVDGNTSKSGLLAMVAAALARVPVRIYHNHGMALSSSKGSQRLLLWCCEWLSCALADEVLYVAPSLRDAAIEEGVCPPRKARAILSINGLDAETRFNPAKLPAGSRAEIRLKCGIGLEDPVLGYVGRLFRVKGIIPLVDAWRELSRRFPNLHMLIAGEFDSRDPLPDETVSALRNHPRIHLVGYVEEPASIYDAIDIEILPSFHEGLGYVLIEASAMERPVIGTRIPGIVDAIRENETGLIIEPGVAQQIVDAVSRYLADPELRRRHGLAGRRMVLEHFSQQRVWGELYQLYARMLRAKGIELTSWSGAASSASRAKRAMKLQGSERL